MYVYAKQPKNTYQILIIQQFLINKKFSICILYVNTDLNNNKK